MWSNFGVSFKFKSWVYKNLSPRYKRINGRLFLVQQQRTPVPEIVYPMFLSEIAVSAFLNNKLRQIKRSIRRL